MAYNHNILDAIKTLTSVNLDDLAAAFGWQGSRLLTGLLRAVFIRPARKFARQMAAYDRLVGELGLPEGARRTLEGYIHELRVHGRENVPREGPVLLLANHPGMSDTLALFAALGRDDLRIIASDRPFLKALPNTSQHLFYLGDDPASRMGAVRKATAHLRAGGAIMTFPAGRIEPDPLVYPGARESLQDWTDSAGIFLRFAPETRILPALVGGVLWDRAVLHPLTRLKPAGEQRERLGAAFQLLAQILSGTRPVTVHVRFAPPVSLDEVGSTDAAAIHAVLLERMRGLLDQSEAHGSKTGPSGVFPGEGAGG